MVVNSAIFDCTMGDLVEDYLVRSLASVVSSMLINEARCLKVIDMVNANSVSKNRPLKVVVYSVVGHQMANIAYGGGEGESS